jgi:hypothetical protein
MTIKLPPVRASDGQAVLSPAADPRANRETEPSSTISRRRSGLSLEGRRLRKLTDGELADEVGTLEARIDALKAEAIRREIRRAEGEDFRITLTPPGPPSAPTSRCCFRSWGSPRRNTPRASATRCGPAGG